MTPERELVEVVHCEECGGLLWSERSKNRRIGPACLARRLRRSMQAELEREGQLKLFQESEREESAAEIGDQLNKGEKNGN